MPPPRPVKSSRKRIAAECVGLYFMFLTRLSPNFLHPLLSVVIKKFWTQEAIFWREILTSLYLYLVLRSIKTPYDHISGISLLVDSSVVICACKRFSWQLVRYSLQSGKEMSRAQLAEPPQGMARVTLGGEQRIALSYGYTN